MGEAKRRRDNLKQHMFTQVERWMVPERPWERDMVAEIAKLPVVRAVKCHPDLIKYMRMAPGKCHENCEWYATYPENAGHWQPVLGWLTHNAIQSDVYVVHSVLREIATSSYLCITPNAAGDTGVFEISFVPDDQLIHGRNGVVRHGHTIGVGIRRDPPLVIAEAAAYKEHLLKGGPRPPPSL